VGVRNKHKKKKNKLFGKKRPILDKYFVPFRRKSLCLKCFIF